MSSHFIQIVGSVPKLEQEDASRLAVHLVQGREVLAKAPLAQDGSFQLTLSRSAATRESPYAYRVVLAPASMGDLLGQVSDAPSLGLTRDELNKAEGPVRIKGEALLPSADILRRWWSWCRQYCVSGTLIGSSGCPVPGAEVTVYSVAHVLSGFSKVPRASVMTDQNGHFTACFEWCSAWPCWPCWPIWWSCWPWWWERDILHVIETIEQQLPQIGPGPVEYGLNAALIQPEGQALIRGQGFAQVARVEAFAQDVQRTELIRAKFNDARIRSLFPWYWWCCESPNIVFSASQAGVSVLNENPANATRWCLADGSNVSLVANAQAVTACTGGPEPASGFLWTRVGSIPVDGYISQGYTSYWGGDAVDAAFAGTLDIYGGFAPGTPVAYYQVMAGQWSGDPARGGTAPISAAPLAADLYDYAWVLDSHGNMVSQGYIKMGPFNQGVLVNLYATEAQRQAGPTPPGLAPFPAVPAGGTVYWAYVDRRINTSSSTLVGGNVTGAVDLTLLGYDASLASLALTPDAPLTLTIDNVPLSNTTAHVNSVTAFRADHSPALQLGTGDCPAFDAGPGGYVQIDVTVSDANGHLYEYYVSAERGHGVTDIVPPGTHGYIVNPLGSPDYVHKSWTGGNEVLTYVPPSDCCYEFRIRAGKRVTNGYDSPSLQDYDFQTVNLKVSS